MNSHFQYLRVKTALFLSHGTPSISWVSALGRLADRGIGIIASDKATGDLRAHGVRNTTKVGEHRGNSRVKAMNLSYPPLSEEILVGLSTVKTLPVVERMIEADLPVIDLVVIDMAAAFERRDALKANAKPEIQHILDAIAPNLSAAIPHAIKGKRLVVTNEANLAEVVEAIEAGVFEDETQLGRIEQIYNTCNTNSWLALNSINRAVAAAFKSVCEESGLVLAPVDGAAEVVA